MKREEFQHVKEIFQSAIQIAPDKRDDFLGKACKSDVGLRQEVERLIDAEDSEFMEEPAMAQVAEVIVEKETENEPTKIFDDYKTKDQFGHYEIVSRIGKGGMGEVFLAKDTTLDRKVAIKFLAKKFVGDPDKLKRFIQEAKAASALNNPNILTVYEIGEHDKTSFIVTEFIEGRDLNQYLAEEKVSPEDVLNISVQIVSALETAHAAGIIHRDIKPANIKVRDDGLVKILDFGLAKLTEKPTADEIDSEAETIAKISTLTGLIMGTPNYMSPEQARGKKTDERTDIFSFGIVLYEMLSGHNPFSRDSVTDTIIAIAREDPPPISAHVANLPSELEEIVARTLCRELDGRYQTAKDLHNDLEKIKRRVDFENELERLSSPVTGDEDGGPVTLGGIQSPTLMKKPDTDEGIARQTISAEYVVGQMKTHKMGALLIFAALLIGVTATGYYFLLAPSKTPVLTDKDVILLIDFENKTGEEIFDGTLKPGVLMQLRQSPFLSIFPEPEVEKTLKLMNHKPDERVTREVGREICQRQGLKALITGSIVKLELNYLLTLVAINGLTGERIEITQDEAKGKDDIRRSISEVSRQMREKLGESLRSIEKFDKPLEVTTSSLEAFKVYSMGMKQFSSGRLREATALYEKAIELDPEFATAYVALAGVHYASGGIDKLKEMLIKARALSNKISEREKLRIDYWYYDEVLLDHNEVIKLLNIAMQMYPRDAEIRSDLARASFQSGEFEQAVSAGEEAIRLNPKAATAYNYLVGSYISLGRFDEAKKTIELASREIPSRGKGYGTLYNIAFAENDTETMQQILVKLKGKPGLARLQAQTAVNLGQWKKYREFASKEISRLAQGGISVFDSENILRAASSAATLDQCGQYMNWANKALKPVKSPHKSIWWMFLARALHSLAKCGDVSRAQAVMRDLVKEYPEATLLNKRWVPVIKAEIALKNNRPDEAVRLLDAERRFENKGAFLTRHIRGRAFLKLNENEKARNEYQTILDDRGGSKRSVRYTLAQLGKARATKDKQEYEKFFEMWKDADKDLPALVSARKEYENLK